MKRLRVDARTVCLLYSCHNDSEKIHLNDSFCEISVFLKKVSDDDNDY